MPVSLETETGPVTPLAGFWIGVHSNHPETSLLPEVAKQHKDILHCRLCKTAFFPPP